MKSLACLCVSICAALQSSAAPPTLDELSGKRLPCATLEQMPAICNSHGGVAAGRNVLSIVALTVPPLSQGGEGMRLLLDGKDVVAEWSRWLPYEIQRGTSLDGIAVETRARMVFEESCLLLRVQLTNNTKSTRQSTLSVTDAVIVRRFNRTWEWATPRPDSGLAEFHMERSPDGLLLVTDAPRTRNCGRALG